MEISLFFILYFNFWRLDRIGDSNKGFISLGVELLKWLQMHQNMVWAQLQNKVQHFWSTSNAYCNIKGKIKMVDKQKDDAGSKQGYEELHGFV